MDFSFSEMQVALRKSVIEFARNELNGNLVENERSGVFPIENWRACSDMDLMGLPIPEAYGGQGQDILTTVVAIEALGYACKDSGLVHSIITQMLCGLQTAVFGSEAQKQTYLSGICKGDLICAQAITEPDSGSDAMAMRTIAEENNGSYKINGSKVFISNGPIADLVIVYALTNPERKALGGVSCLIVEKECRGFSRSRPLDKMGLRTLQNGELFFNDCIVPAENLLGKPGQGAMAFNEMMQLERTLMFAAHIGVLERVLKTCVAYCNSRAQSGETIGKFQSTSNKIADMTLSLELGRLILYKSAWLKSRNKRSNLESSLAKLFISESIKKACLEAIQIHGAYGYMKEYELERDLRDSIASTIYSGTSEIQRNIISKLAGLK